MMTIDELADQVALEFIQENRVAIATDGPKYRALVIALVGMAQQVARDQRHACAEAVNGVSTWVGISDDDKPLLTVAHAAVMNATIK